MRCVCDSSPSPSLHATPAAHGPSRYGGMKRASFMTRSRHEINESLSQISLSLYSHLHLTSSSNSRVSPSASAFNSFAFYYFSSIFSPPYSDSSHSWFTDQKLLTLDTVVILVSRLRLSRFSSSSSFSSCLIIFHPHHTVWFIMEQCRQLYLEAQRDLEGKCLLIDCPDDNRPV